MSVALRQSAGLEDGTCPVYELCSKSDGKCIYDPVIIPSCFMALAIGVTFFRTFRKQKFTGARSYATTWLMFGIMMSDALFVHVFMNESGKSWFSPFFTMFIAIVDMGLTSCIAVSFLFNGLIDLRILHERTKLNAVLRYLSYAAVFTGYTVGFLTQWKLTVWVMYMAVVFVGCGAYCVMQVIWIIKHRECAGWGWLVVAGVTGLIGLVGTVKFGAALCKFHHNIISPDDVWFYLSDLSMVCLAKYILSSRRSQQRMARMASRGADDRAPLVHHAYAATRDDADDAEASRSPYAYFMQQQQQQPEHTLRIGGRALPFAPTVVSTPSAFNVPASHVYESYPAVAQYPQQYPQQYSQQQQLAYVAAADPRHYAFARSSDFFAPHLKM